MFAVPVMSVVYKFVREAVVKKEEKHVNGEEKHGNVEQENEVKNEDKR